MPFVDLRIDSDDVLSSLNEADVVQYFGEEALLGEIGEDRAKEYFDLVNKED